VNVVRRIAPSLALALAGTSAFAADTSAVSDKFRWLTFVVFGVIIGLTMYVTYLAARRVKSASQFYAAGYADQVLPGVASGRVTPPELQTKVDAYITYNLGLTWTGIKGLSITALVKNVLDTDPPFAINYDSNFGSGSSWEPRVADPRGRAFVVSAEYRF
jgi:iron complex outermembrane receptor protein